MKKTIKFIVLLISSALFFTNSIYAEKTIDIVGAWSLAYGEDEYYEADTNRRIICSDWITGRDKGRVLQMQIYFFYQVKPEQYYISFHWEADLGEGDLYWNTVSLRDDVSGKIYSNLIPIKRDNGFATFNDNYDFLIDFIRRGKFSIILTPQEPELDGNAVFKVSSYDVRKFDEAVNRICQKPISSITRKPTRSTASQNTPARSTVSPSSGFKKLTGSIGKYGVTMSLDLANNKGSHFYNSRPSSVFQLQVVTKNCISNDGYGNAIYDVIIKEIWQEKPTGTYEGRIIMKNDKIYQFSGKFTNSKATVFDFMLKEP